MDMSVATICDLLIVVLLIASVLHGLYEGLILKLGLIAAAFAAFLAAGVLAASIGSHYDLSFLVLFVVLSFVFRRAVTVLKLVDKLPVIGPLDRIGGGICGFLLAFIVIYLIANLVFGLVPQQILDQWGLTADAVSQTRLLRSFLGNDVWLK